MFLNQFSSTETFSINSVATPNFNSLSVSASWSPSIKSIQLVLHFCSVTCLRVVQNRKHLLRHLQIFDNLFVNFINRTRPAKFTNCPDDRVHELVVARNPTRRFLVG